MVWYSHLYKNFPQFVVIHTVKGFGIVNKAEVDVFLELFRQITEHSICFSTASAQNNLDAKVACLGGGMFWDLQPLAWSPVLEAAQRLGRRVLCSLVPPLSRAATGSAG